jgi:hypothetical protein
MIKKNYLLASLIIIFCYLCLGVQTDLIQSKPQLYWRNDKRNTADALLVLIRNIYQ